MTGPVPFAGDAGQDDPLIALRVAVTSPNPAGAYLVAFDRAGQARPTQTEAAVLASYLDSCKLVLYRGDSRVLARLPESPVDHLDDIEEPGAGTRNLTWQPGKTSHPGELPGVAAAAQA